MEELLLIVALDENDAIGRRGRMPWHLPADLAHFKRTTRGHAVIMGRRTYESIGRPLPDRQNIVITRQPHWRACGVETAASLEQALALARTDRRFVIGGGELYREALPRAQELHLTRVRTAVAGADTWFPAIDPGEWEELSREERPADERNPFPLTFLRYRRASPAGHEAG